MVRQFLSTLPLDFGDSIQFVSELVTCVMWTTRPVFISLYST